MNELREYIADRYGYTASNKQLREIAAVVLDDVFENWNFEKTEDFCIVRHKDEHGLSGVLVRDDDKEPSIAGVILHRLANAIMDAKDGSHD